MSAYFLSWSPNTLSKKGPPHGRLRQRENVHAFADFVSCLPRIPTSIINGRGHSSNNPASLTARLGATIDVEQNHVRFLGDLILNLWDCGGQDAFMDSYLTTQRSTIFQHVGVIIYVFDADQAARTARRSGEERENRYFIETLDGLRQHSPDAAVFLLIHKMDLIKKDRATWFEKKKAGVLEMMKDVKNQLTGDVQVFGTSIYDETLYKVFK